MKRKNIKNTILKATARIMGILFLVSACALDSDSWIPHIVCMVSLLWLALFAYANGQWGGYTDDAF